MKKDEPVVDEDGRPFRRLRQKTAVDFKDEGDGDDALFHPTGRRRLYEKTFELPDEVWKAMPPELGPSFGVEQEEAAADDNKDAPDGVPRKPDVSTARKKPAAAAKIQPSKTPLVVEEAPVMCMDKIGPWAKHKLTQDDPQTGIGLLRGGAYKPTIAEKYKLSSRTLRIWQSDKCRKIQKALDKHSKALRMAAAGKTYRDITAACDVDYHFATMALRCYPGVAGKLQ